MEEDAQLLQEKWRELEEKQKANKEGEAQRMEALWRDREEKVARLAEDRRMREQQRCARKSLLEEQRRVLFEAAKIKQVRREQITIIVVGAKKWYLLSLLV